MKKRIIFFIVMASLIYSGLFAQSPPKNGIGFLDAIPAVSYTHLTLPTTPYV